MAENDSTLTGIWKLISFDVEMQQTGERGPLYTDGPTNGYLILTPQGRMMAIVTGGRRQFGQTDQEQAALFRTMLSYTGMYRVEGDKFITRVDLSSNEIWNGSDQIRYFKLRGGLLDIVSEWAPSPIHPGRPMTRGILSWKRSE